MSQRGWIKIYSETYQDCIVGNREGLSSLKKAVDTAIENKHAPIESFCQSDFLSVVATTEAWNDTEASSIPKLQELIFELVLFVWLVALPIIGCIALYVWL